MFVVFPRIVEDGEVVVMKFNRVHCELGIAIPSTEGEVIRIQPHPGSPILQALVR